MHSQTHTYYRTVESISMRLLCHQQVMHIYNKRVLNTSVTPSRSTQVRSIDEFRTDFLYDLERLARRERCASATNDTTPATTLLNFQSNYIKISFV